MVQNTVAKHRLRSRQCWSVSFLVRRPLGVVRLTLRATAFDSENLMLYVAMHQTFSLALIPFHHAHVALTTVLHLTTDKLLIHSDPSSPLSETSQPTKESQNLLHGQPIAYRITTQEDFYQPTEFMKFLPGGWIGSLLITLWQYWNTFLSTLGALVGYPFTVYLQRRDQEKETQSSASLRARVGQEDD